MTKTARTETALFLLTLWVGLILAWIFSGEQFLDLVFAVPDLGPIDDLAIDMTVWLEERRAALSPPDLFAALRRILHAATGLG